jgi:hypothetical protein
MESDEKTPPPGAVFELAEQAVAWVRKATSIVLDYTADTLPLLDHWLSQVPRDQPETIRLTAAAAGAYFGEVARATLGGSWRIKDEQDPSSWHLVLAGGIDVVPMGVAAEAILQGPLDDVDATFDVPAAQRGAVEEALADREVPEDEYYSLSGRLETYAFIADVIAANERTSSNN